MTPSERLRQLQGTQGQATPTAAPSPSARLQQLRTQVSQPAVQEQPYTFEMAAKDPELLNAVRSFAKWRSDENLKSDEETFDWFKENMRDTDMNTVAIVRQAVNARQADDEQKRNLALMMRRWEQLPAFWQKGGEGASGLFQNVQSALVDPANLIGLGVGGVAAKAAARQGLKPLARFATTTAATAAVDAPIAAGSNYATQSAQRDVGLRDEISGGEVGLAAGLGAASSVAGGALGEVGAAIARRAAPAQVNLQTTPLAGIMRDQSELKERTFQLYDPATDRVIPNADFKSFSEAKKATGQFNNPVLIIEDGNIKFSGNDIVNSRIRRRLSVLENKVFNDKAPIERLVSTTAKYGNSSRIQGMLDALETSLTTENAGLVAEMATMGHRPKTYTVGGKQITVGQDMAAQFRWNDATGAELIQGSTSMADILTRLRDEQGPEAVNLLEEFMVGARAAQNMAGTGRKEAKNVTNRMTQQDIEAALQDPIYAPLKPYVQEMQTFNKNFLDFMVDSQLISAKEASDLLSANSVYLPFARLEQALDMTEGELSVLTTTLQKELKGVAGATQDEGFVRTLALRQYRHSVEAAMLKGFENIRSRAVVRQVETLPPEMQKLILREVPTSGDNTFTVRLNGKTKHYEVGDEALLATLQRFGPDPLRDQPENIVGQLAQAHTQLLTYAITRWPEFVVATSAPMEMVTGYVMSDAAKTAPIQNFARGITMMSNDKLVKEALAAGALQGGVVSQENARLIRRFFEKNGISTQNLFGIDSKTDAQILARLQNAVASWTTDNLAARPLRAANVFAEKVEGATRVNEFAQQLQTTGGNVGKAGARAIQNNINFRTKGQSQFINSVMSTMPFLRAAMNGVYQPAKKLTRGGLKQQQARLVGFSAALMGLYAYNMTYHKEAMEAKIDSERAMFMWFFPGTDYEFKIRKDQILGLPANMAEYMVTQLQTEKEDAVKALADTFVFGATQVAGNYFDPNSSPAALIQNYIPPILSGPLSLATNERLGGQIEPSWMQGLPTEDRYIPGRTPMSMRWMSENVGVLSPVQYEHLFRAWTGPVATAVADIDRASNPELSLRQNVYDLPVVRRFASDPDEPRRMTRWSEDFYKLAEEYGVDARALEAGTAEARIGVIEGVVKRLASDPMAAFEYGAYGVFQQTAKELAEARSTIREIEESTVSPQKKEEANRKVQRTMNMAMETTVRAIYNSRRQFRDITQTKQMLEDQKK